MTEHAIEILTSLECFFLRPGMFIAQPTIAKAMIWLDGYRCGIRAGRQDVPNDRTEEYDDLIGWMLKKVDFKSDFYSDVNHLSELTDGLLSLYPNESRFFCEGAKVLTKRRRDNESGINE